MRGEDTYSVGQALASLHVREGVLSSAQLHSSSLQRSRLIRIGCGTHRDYTSAPPLAQNRPPRTGPFAPALAPPPGPSPPRPAEQPGLRNRPTPPGPRPTLS